MSGSEWGDGEERDEVTLWTPNPVALAELHDASWRGRSAPDFGEAVGSCRAHPNPDIWFSDHPRERLEAQAICATCPVAEGCFAQSPKEETGIWGGKPRDGRPIRPDVCSKGHDTWRTRSGGRRYCITCRREARAA